MTEAEAVELLSACKPLAMRLTTIPLGIAPVNLALSKEDFKAMEGFVRVQHDPIIAGPGLLNRLYKLAELNQVEVSKLDLVMRLLDKRRYAGRLTTLRFENQ